MDVITRIFAVALFALCSLGVLLMQTSTRVFAAEPADVALSTKVHIKVVDANAHAMDNMVVYLQAKSISDASSAYKTPKAAQGLAIPVEVHQKDKQFTPYITVVQKGHELQFVNDDDITHHIYSAIGPKRFSFKLRQDDATKTMVFDKIGQISMGCNIHDWMSGHILVVDTPYFSATGVNGTAELNGIPAGEYELIVWHPQLNSPSHRQVFAIHKNDNPLVFTATLNAEMGQIPEQKSLDDFEFLEGYE
ncbi:hypothetical protein TUM4261_07070 [Shewanella sp. c952]|uniref:hypothetical protein n=1 Tax=Shewanella sp. c952 TaxID=2815913 RepID=UPI001BC22B98|nr:hypothetical protein [Shewanella sp. c952]GIU05340.1 hypothetical protein TUM4261_07070 [Shewanella sp. c952]